MEPRHVPTIAVCTAAAPHRPSTHASVHDHPLAASQAQVPNVASWVGYTQPFSSTQVNVSPEEHVAGGAHANGAGGGGTHRSEVCSGFAVRQPSSQVAIASTPFVFGAPQLIPTRGVGGSFHSVWSRHM